MRIELDLEAYSLHVLQLMLQLSAELPNAWHERAYYVHWVAEELPRRHTFCEEVVSVFRAGKIQVRVK